MKRTIVPLILCFLLVSWTSFVGLASSYPDLSGVTLNIAAGAIGMELQLSQEAAREFEERTGARVVVLELPDLATDRLSLYQQILGIRSQDIDVFQVDVIWPGMLQENAVDLYQYIPRDEVQAHFPAIVENNTINGALIGLPWFGDAGLLYYRIDLLEKYGYTAPPETWAELEEMAQTIQVGERAAGRDDFWGFVWQGARNEGLTCNALEWQYSYGGGSIVEPDGTVSVDNPQVIAALEMAKGWIGTITPSGVTGYGAEDSRSIWHAGNAAFMRNWPYAYAPSQADGSPIQDKFAVAPLPSGGYSHAATLGGWQLMVSRYSENVEAAVHLVRFLSSYEQQKKRAIVGSFIPTIMAVFDDAEVLEARPFFGSLQEVFVNAVARPSTVTGRHYSDVSNAYFTSVHQILSGQREASAHISRLATQINRLLR